MKKIFTLFAALTMVMSMFAAQETVYFVNAHKWTGTINAYAWTSTPNAEWPGAPAKKEATKIGGYDVYSYTAEAGTYANIIFNNGSAQTEDLKWTAGKYYVKDGWYTKEEAEKKLAAPVEYESVYFVNVAGWETVKIYTWSPSIAGWPGVDMKKEANKLGGYDVYSYSVEKGSSFGGMLFTCGGDECKTGDLQWTPGKYFVKGKWYTKEEAEAQLAQPQVDVYIVAGAAVLLGSEWSNNDANNTMTKQADESYLLVKKNVTLTNDTTYEYKVVKNEDWNTAYPADNATLTVPANGTYDVTFKFVPSTSEVSATATAAATAVEDVEATQTNVKFILNGQMVVRYNGKLYNVMGQEVKE